MLAEENKRETLTSSIVLLYWVLIRLCGGGLEEGEGGKEEDEVEEG